MRQLDDFFDALAYLGASDHLFHATGWVFDATRANQDVCVIADDGHLLGVVIADWNVPWMAPARDWLPYLTQPKHRPDQAPYHGATWDDVVTHLSDVDRRKVIGQVIYAAATKRPYVKVILDPIFDPDTHHTIGYQPGQVVMSDTPNPGLIAAVDWLPSMNRFGQF